MVSVRLAWERALEHWSAELEHSLSQEVSPISGVSLRENLLALRPLLLPEGTSRSVAGQVRRVVARLVRRIEALQNPEELAGITAVLQGERLPFRSGECLDLLRPDGVLDASGRFTLFEVNAGSTVGGLVELQVLAETMERWAQRYVGEAAALMVFYKPATELARMLRRQFGPHLRVAWTAPNGALQDGSWDPLVRALDGIFRREGMRCVAAEAKDLRVSWGGVRHRGRRVHLLFRVAEGWDWLLREEFAHLRRAVERKQVLLYSSPWDLVLNAKAALAEYSREELASERAARVPWTRVVRPAVENGIDVLPHVRAHAEKYVLKPSIGSQGRRVVMGREDPVAFVQTLGLAVLSGDMVVQALEEPPVVRIPYREEGALVFREVRAVVSPILLRGSASGMGARLSVPGKTWTLTHPYAGTTALVPVVEVR